jgi:hypothetical protein
MMKQTFSGLMDSSTAGASSPAVSWVLDIWVSPPFRVPGETSGGWAKFLPSKSPAGSLRRGFSLNALGVRWLA